MKRSLNYKICVFFGKKNKNNHENTKSEKHEKFHGFFRVFVLSCFRDKKSFSFYSLSRIVFVAHHSTQFKQKPSIDSPDIS